MTATQVEWSHLRDELRGHVQDLLRECKDAQRKAHKTVSCCSCMNVNWEYQAQIYGFATGFARGTAERILALLDGNSSDGLSTHRG